MSGVNFESGRMHAHWKSVETKGEISAKNVEGHGKIKHVAHHKGFKHHHAAGHEKTVITPNKLTTTFHESAKTIKWQENEQVKYKAVGTTYGGIKELNLSGHIFIVPKDPAKVLAAYKEAKDKIAKVIHIDESTEHMTESKAWTNTSTTAEELIGDATGLKDEYATFVKNLAAQNHGRACFGHHDKFILKGMSSLQRKLKDDVKELKCSAEYAVQRAGDSLRGSVVVNSPQDITNLAAALQVKAKEHNWDITFKNIWKEDRSSGYVGVHAKMKLVNSEGRTVLAELQIHLPQIYDGEPTCVKDYIHRIYEYGREAYWAGKEKSLPRPPSFANHISILQMLSHIEEIKV